MRRFLTSPARGGSRAALALLLALALALPGLADGHSAAERASADGGAGGLAVELAAAHAAAPAHFDAPTARVVSHCLVCVAAARPAAHASPAPEPCGAPSVRSEPLRPDAAAPRGLDLPLPPGRSPPFA